MSLFVDRAGRRRLVFGKPPIDATHVKAGATFARTGARDMVETAEVISIQEHAGGVAHVHYTCRLQHSSTVLENGSRTLALQAFVERFQQQPARSQTFLKG
jgi:hypothetical protein